MWGFWERTVRMGRNSADRIDINARTLNKVIKPGYCGPLTVRQVAAIALYDKTNFPLGLDTPLHIGDFEGNFQCATLSVMGGDEGALCVCGDPHGG